MNEDYLPSQDLQKTFQKWFGDSVPADSPSDAEAKHSIVDSHSSNLSFPPEVHHSYHITRGRYRYDLAKLPELFSFGCRGAISLGAVVGFIILIMNINYVGWSRNWPSQIIVITIALIIGFFGGLFRGSIYKLRERFSYKNDL
jgi:hypothetical protein